MLDLLRGAPDIAGLQQALEERDAEIATLQDRLQAYQDADQRDFLADNSDQLATIISTKNQVIQELQAQLQALDSGGGALASALEAARTSAAEVERLRKHVEAAELELRSSDRRLREHQHQLQLYREENNRQAGELASSAAKSAVDIGRLQAALKVATEKSARLESKAALQQLGATPATEPSKEHERMMLQKEEEFELCCAERVKALEAREAAMVESQAAVKQHDALEQEVQEQMRVLEERKRMMLQKEEEFELCCAERVRALEAREAAAVELERVLQQQQSGEQLPGKDDAQLQGHLSQQLSNLEGREARLLQKEAELEQRQVESDRLLQSREVAAAEREAQLREIQAEEETRRSQDDTVRRCFHEELEEQKQLLAEREQAALEQEAALERRELALEESQQDSEGPATRNDSEEVKRLHDSLTLATQDLQASQGEADRARAAAQDFAAKAQRLEAQLSRLRAAEEASQQRVAQIAKGGQLPVATSGVAGAIASMLQDVELGERAGVSLVDLGLSDVSGLPQADKFMQLVSALMAVRADARLTVFGLWLLCHLIYVVYLVYAHLVK